MKTTLKPNSNREQHHMTMIAENDIQYEYTTRGYMMYYKGRPIGGASIGKGARGCRSNLSLFRNAAESTKSAILNGRIDAHMRKAMEKIDANLKELQEWTELIREREGKSNA